jgi:DNA-binding phage protein
MAMAGKSPTSFDRFFDEQMKDPAFAAEYQQARAEIDGTDKLVRALDGARALRGMSKADLAREIQARPEVLRRLFTAKGANPTMDTVLKVVTALGFHLELVPNEVSSGRRAAPRPGASRQTRRK